MSEIDAMVSPLLVVAEFVFTADGEAEFLLQLDRTLEETRGVDGCIQAVLWKRPGRRYLFSTLWDDAAALKRWVDNEFHRKVLMPGFRKWCTEGCFGEYTLQTDHKRARKCSSCGRWTQDLPGWDEARPSTCGPCGSLLDPPSDARGA
jgi:heme-degrading monooxygenase HmoA